MSEISEKAIKLIKDFRRDISIDIMFTPEKNAEDDSLKALVDYIAELEAAQRWMPVSERLPEANEMNISKHANYLLNEYGRLQFDYAAYCKPYGESLRNEARNNLEEYIAELEAAQHWIPVSERLPEHGDFVLAWDNEIIEVLEYIRTFGGEWFIDIADAAVYPTHWMPLPQPPEVQQ